MQIAGLLLKKSVYRATFLALLFPGCSVSWLSLKMNGEPVALYTSQHRKPLEVTFDVAQKKAKDYNQRIPANESTFAQNRKQVQMMIDSIVKNNNFVRKNNADYRIKITSYVPDNSNPPLAGCLGIATLGLIPIWAFKHYEFEMEVFYKGEKLKRYDYALDKFGLLGWIAIPINAVATPFVDSMDYTMDMSLIGEKAFASVAKPLLNRIAYDALNDFNIDLSERPCPGSVTPRRIAIFTGTVFEVKGDKILVTFKDRGSPRPGLLIFFADGAGNITGQGTVTLINFSNLQVRLVSGQVAKGFVATGYKEVL